MRFSQDCLNRAIIISVAQALATRCVIDRRTSTLLGLQTPDYLNVTKASALSPCTTPNLACLPLTLYLLSVAASTFASSWRCDSVESLAVDLRARLPQVYIFA